MRRDLRILSITMVLGAVATWGGRVPEALSRMESFRIDDVEVRGLRYLTREDVVEQMAMDPSSSVWSDTGPFSERLLAHPMIREARVRRRMPNGLRVTIVERRPVALAPTPILEPIDADGYRLPLDPAAYRLDLPVISTSETPPRGSRLFTEDVRVLAAEVGNLMGADTAFLQMVSSVERAGRGAIVARWSEPPVDFYLPPSASPGRLREGLTALADAVARRPSSIPDAIDLRFADQVVVRRTREP